MIFKSQKQLEDFLLQKCRAAIVGTEQKVHNVIDKCLRRFYAQFEPEEYIRTEQLLHSLVKGNVEKRGNGYVAEVYFDVSGLNYKNGYIEIKSTATTGEWGYAAWGRDTILDVVMTGSYGGKPHGGYEGGTAIWSDSMRTIDALGGVYKMLEQELRLIGVPIKKK